MFNFSVFVIFSKSSLGNNDRKRIIGGGVLIFKN